MKNQSRWKNAIPALVSAVITEVVAAVQACLGRLPENVGAEEFCTMTLPEFLDYCERLSEDDDYWSALPTWITPSAEKSKIEKTYGVYNLIAAAMNMPLFTPRQLTDTLEKPDKGLNKNVTRARLNVALADCRL